MEKTFTLDFTDRELNTLLQSLGEIPAKISMPLIVKIKTEAERQLAQAQQPEENVHVAVQDILDRQEEPDCAKDQ